MRIAPRESCSQVAIPIKLRHDRRSFDYGTCDGAPARACSINGVRLRYCFRFYRSECAFVHICRARCLSLYQHWRLRAHHARVCCGLPMRISLLQPASTLSDVDCGRSVVHIGLGNTSVIIDCVSCCLSSSNVIIPSLANGLGSRVRRSTSMCRARVTAAATNSNSNASNASTTNSNQTHWLG